MLDHDAVQQDARGRPAGLPVEEAGAVIQSDISRGARCGEKAPRGRSWPSVAIRVLSRIAIEIALRSCWPNTRP